jgi:ABC-type transport system substrate-binding protein
MGRTGLLVLIASFLAAASVDLQTPSSAAQTAPVLRLRFLGFSPQTPPADSLTFRQAVASAIDREGVSRVVAPHLRSVLRPATALQHPSLPGYNPAFHAPAFDAAKAREFLAQSGWSGRVTILVSPSTDRFVEAFNQAVSESIQPESGVKIVKFRV